MLSHKRDSAKISLAEHQYTELKYKMLDWAHRSGILLFLDSNSYDDRYGKYECLLAVDAVETITTSFDDLAQWHKQHNDWLFGHICYEYKDRIEYKLSSVHLPSLQFPVLSFFCPAVVCYITADKREFVVETRGRKAADVLEEILQETVPAREPLPYLQFEHRVDKESYLQTIEKLRRHIADGDCYEINYCTEGYCDVAELDPVQVFYRLNELSPAPFATYYKLDDKYLMCASPERYVRKEGDKIVAQPIKGTARRDGEKKKDEQIKTALQQSIKERAENVMIVDLVRNDLARCCKVGSVEVQELFGIYSFPQVHQMISTVSGTLDGDKSFADVLQHTFPMGSMTGAPKIKVMQLIDQYESSRRELFSGTVGYITPGGDLDFNVIIRSLFYNAASSRLSYHTGGAITYDSSAEQEWEEMRLKAWALEKLFS